MRRQAAALRALGLEVVVIRPRALLGRVARAKKGPEDGSTEGAVLDAPYWNLPVRYTPGLSSASCARAVARAWSAHQVGAVDVIHAHRLFPNALAALELGRRLDTPVVITAHGSEIHTHPRKLPGVGELVRTAIRDADTVLAVSQDLGQQIGELARPRNPVRIVYHGVDGGAFSPVRDVGAERTRLGLPEEGVGLCYIGRLVPPKGLGDLFHVLGTLDDAVPPWWIAVVGGGPMMEELKESARKADIRAFFTGPLPHDAVPAWLRSSDIFILPSYGEGLPNAVLEAMSAGLAVVATDVGGISEAVTDGETGALFPVGDQEALGVRLKSLIADGELRAALGDAARRRVQTDFSWQQSARSLVDVYRDTILAHSTRRRHRALL